MATPATVQDFQNQQVRQLALKCIEQNRPVVGSYAMVELTQDCKAQARMMVQPSYWN